MAKHATRLGFKRWRPSPKDGARSGRHRAQELDWTHDEWFSSEKGWDQSTDDATVRRSWLSELRWGRETGDKAISRPRSGGPR